MKKNLRLTGITCTLILSLALTACGASTSQTASPSASPSGADAPAAANSWLEQAGLDLTETTEKLYEKAKLEGKVTVYSQSSRIKDVKASFEAEYPGIEVEAYDMSTNEMIEKLVREQQAGLYNADVVFIKDAGGTVSQELVAEGALHAYMPEDIVSKLAPGFESSPGLPFYFSTRTIFYNTEVYDQAPVNNWWDLTDERWRGKVVVDDPMLSADTMDLLVTMVANSDDMAAAYKEKYGEEIVLDGTENAGYEFIKRLLANDPVFVKSSDDVVTAVGTPGQQDPPLGVSTSSKSRNIVDKGFKMQFIYDTAPKMSVAGTSYLYVADQASHTSAAKLLIRWMAGEADGKAEGFRPYNVLGSWSTRTDINLTEQRPTSELNLWEYDGEFLYQNTQKVIDFILANQ
ncbi:ABC transporter substrate-binding protein [Paenibacillus massiliensis]|uniref:ABC transporter substrate-binding protein n=1 Tax=Paenibacillus massiliensis TaxID=225917 RepID=UPI000422DBF8|nr:extracellular solute-binding protein [Paenibacillus massiliensis]